MFYSVKKGNHLLSTKKKIAIEYITDITATIPVSMIPDRAGEINSSGYLSFSSVLLYMPEYLMMIYGHSWMLNCNTSSPEGK